MKIRNRLMMVAVLVVSIGRAHAAEPQFKAAEPIATTAETPAIVSEGAACADGKCAAGHGKQKDGNCCERLWNWITYSPPKAPCDCHRPTPYRPPLYAWFPCKDTQCHTGHCLKMPEQIQTLAKGKHFDSPLPMPEMPKVLVVHPKPLISGSSTALADKTDAPIVMPSNYRTLPVVPK